MKSLRIHFHGGPEVLKLEDVPMPTVGDGNILIKVHATSLNRMDLWVRQGIPGVGTLPLTLGCDVSGTVFQIGKNVKNFKVGDRVFHFPLFSCEKCTVCQRGDIHLCRDFKIPGEHIDGTHQEYYAAPENKWLPLADTVSFAEGAAFPLAGLTAFHMLVQNGKIMPGQDVLIVAASSGIGSFAVQIAKHFGAHVIATAGDKQKCELAKQLGADAVIDHYKESISKKIKQLTHGKGAELIFEHVGEKVFDECLKSLAWGGRLVTCGATSGPHVKMDLRHIFIKQQQIIGSTMGTQSDLQNVHELVASGKIKPHIAKKFPSSDYAEAQDFLENFKGFGKVILEW